jgi:NAD(P)-dependent dehydrogenase (short-subunit alcohol dehydrogenase family)
MSNLNIFSLKGKTALISGASSGIGLHVAHTFAAAGAAVALGARRMDRIDSAVRELQDAGHRAAAVYLDVTKAETIAAAFDAAEHQLGDVVDVLINNAGVIYAESFIQQAEAEIDRVFDTNLKGAMLVAQEAARRMVAIKRGSIINVASSAGLRAGGFMASYAASKAGLIHLSAIMALELGNKNIRVNVLCPGNIDTEMQTTLTEKGFKDAMLRRTPMRRYGEMEDLDGPFLLLASDAGRYMTGSVITVDGGQTLSWM